MTERNNARAAIIRVIAAIRSGYEHIIAHYNANQPPDMLVMGTNAIDASIAISEHRWMQYDIEEQRALECFRLILCRHLKGAQLELRSSISIWRPRYIQGRCYRSVSLIPKAQQYLIASLDIVRESPRLPCRHRVGRQPGAKGNGKGKYDSTVRSMEPLMQRASLGNSKPRVSTKKPFSWPGMKFGGILQQ